MKKWEMEVEEVEAVLEKIWDLHDKFSDAIHSISRTHFTKSMKNPENLKNTKLQFFDHQNPRNGFVFVKDFDKDTAVAESKSLNSIRSALEHLEDQLEFFHALQIQQRAERETALARLEQSRAILAMRLAEHSGKRYKVIDEAINFVDVRDANSFVGPEHLSHPYPIPHASAPFEIPTQPKGRDSNVFARVLLFGINSTKRTLQLDKLGGLLGNAALFAFSMLALLHIHQVTCKNNYMLESNLKQDRTGKKVYRLDGSSSSGQLSHLDVRLARG